VGELSLLLRRRGVREHHFQAAAFHYDVDPDRPHTTPGACEGCALSGACHRVPAEYLPERPEDALKPLTPGSIAAKVDEALARIDPTSPGAAEALRDLARSLDLLAAIGGDTRVVAGPLSRVREAMGDLMALAIARRDLVPAVSAFCVYFDLYPKTQWRADSRTSALLTLPPARLGPMLGALHPGEAARMPFRLRLGGRFEVALRGAAGAGGEVLIEELRPILLDAATIQDRAALALFLLVFCEPLRKARRARVTGDVLEIDTGSGYYALWLMAKPGAIVIEGAQAPEGRAIQPL
jgi:hypothetical protein